jgi:hypothetical protein
VAIKCRRTNLLKATPYSLLLAALLFAWWTRFSTLKMEAVLSSETLVSIYETVRSDISADSTLLFSLK